MSNSLSLLPFLVDDSILFVGICKISPIELFKVQTEERRKRTKAEKCAWMNANRYLGAAIYIMPAMLPVTIKSEFHYNWNESQFTVLPCTACLYVIDKWYKFAWYNYVRQSTYLWKKKRTKIKSQNDRHGWTQFALLVSLVQYLMEFYLSASLCLFCWSSGTFHSRGNSR